MALSEAGRRAAAANARREAEIFPELSRGLSVEEIRAASRVLRTLKAAFEGERWQRLLHRDAPDR